MAVIRIFFLFASLALAAGNRSLTTPEFRALAEDLAPRVSLFADAWTFDPDAEFYGGTTRDFLYWIKGGLAAGQSPAELRRLKQIDVREFIIGDSDVDVVTVKKGFSLDPSRYGVKRIDPIARDRFDPKTEMGKNELNQGIIPVEKIRLSRHGFVDWKGVGDGIREIHDGRPTVRFAAPRTFARTYYAQRKENHPVLLALRYLRILAMNYYQHEGRGVPKEKVLFDIDRESFMAVKDVFAKAGVHGALDEYLAQPRFHKWIDDTIAKAFRSYTNPTAAKRLSPRRSRRAPTHARTWGSYRPKITSAHPVPKAKGIAR